MRQVSSGFGRRTPDLFVQDLIRLQGDAQSRKPKSGASAVHENIVNLKTSWGDLLWSASAFKALDGKNGARSQRAKLLASAWHPSASERAAWGWFNSFGHRVGCCGEPSHTTTSH